LKSKGRKRGELRKKRRRVQRGEQRIEESRGFEREG
jgi:hypothetical protein